MEFPKNSQYSLLWPLLKRSTSKEENMRPWSYVRKRGLSKRTNQLTKQIYIYDKYGPLKKKMVTYLSLYGLL